MKRELPSRLSYRGAVYVRATSQLYTYSDLHARGGVEAGVATDSAGNHYPGWADRHGWKYAEIESDAAQHTKEQQFLRIDNQEGWLWEWDTGINQDIVVKYYGSDA